MLVYSQTRCCITSDVTGGCFQQIEIAAYGAISGTARMKNGAGKREVRIVYTEEIIPAAILFFPNRSQSFLSNTLILAVMNVIFAIAWRRLKNSGFQRGFNP